MWIVFAFCSAFLTALTGTISKSALDRVHPVFGLALQSTVIMICTWIAVLLTGKARAQATQIELKDVGLLAASGFVSCIAFLCYFGALSSGESSRVQPVDRLSLVFAVVLAALFLGERINSTIITGAVLMAIGATIIAFAPGSK